MTKLKQIATINPGYPFRGKIEETAGTGIWAIQMKDTSLTEGICLASCVETALTGKRQPDWLQPGDILFAARGSNNYAVLIDNTLNDNGINAIAAPHFFVMRSHSQQILPEFLAWQLNQPPCQRYFEQNAEGTFTKSLRRSVMEETPIVIPPIAKQRSVVALTHTLLEEQRQLKKIIDNGQTLIKAIANDLLER